MKTTLSVGRPTQRDARLENIALNLAKEGKTNQQISKIIGIGLSTFSRWIAEDPKFRDALAGAKRQFDTSVVENMLLKRCLGMRICETKTRKDAQGKILEVIDTQKEIPPDPGCLALYLRNRMPDIYSEKNRTEIELILQNSQGHSLRELAKLVEVEQCDHSIIMKRSL